MEVEVLQKSEIKQNELKQKKLIVERRKGE
jgi:hypothetical protein